MAETIYSHSIETADGDIRETVCEHMAEKSTFTVTAAEQWSKAMVRRLKARFPDEVEITAENKDGSLVAHMPLKWMKIKPTYTRNLTEEQREALRQRAHKNLHGENCD